jgi:hypothetical protein
VATPDPVVELLPWYANGTLDVQKRREVEAHLRSCADCRELLRHALDLRDIFGDPAEVPLGDHVHAQLLAEFADAPDALEDETVRRVREHLAGCEACADALEACRAEPAEERRPAPAGVASRLWGLLAGSVLRPVPALAYLLALGVLLYPAARHLLTRPGAGAGPGLPLVREVVSLRGEPTYRDGGDAATPVEILRPAGGSGLVLLELRTDLDDQDLRDRAAGFTVEIREGERVIESRNAGTRDLGDEGVLRVALAADRYPADHTYAASLVYRKPGHPLDGRVVFRRSFRFVEGP